MELDALDLEIIHLDYIKAEAEIANTAKDDDVKAKAEAEKVASETTSAKEELAVELQKARDKLANLKKASEPVVIERDHLNWEVADIKKHNGEVAQQKVDLL